MLGEDWIIYLIFFGGGLVHSVLGFGFPLFTTPFISMIHDIRYAILLTIIPTILNNLFNIIKGGPFIDLVKRYIVLAFVGVIGSFLGTYLIIYFPAEPFKLILSISIAIYLYTRYRKIELTFIQENFFNMMIFGLLGGIVGGTVNVSLAVYVIFLLNLGLSKAATIKVINYCFVLGKIAQLITFSLFGYYDYPLLKKITISSIAVIPGMMIGYQLRKRITEGAFRRILYGVLVVGGIIIGYQGIRFFFP